jgi:hypothetical protein
LVRFFFDGDPKFVKAIEAAFVADGRAVSLEAADAGFDVPAKFGAVRSSTGSADSASVFTLWPRSW